MPRLIPLCAQAGVAVVLAPELKGQKASCLVQWLTPSQVPQRKAMLLLSLRYRRDDHFWFSFYHAAAHLILERVSLGGPSRPRGCAPLAVPESCSEASRIAADLLIPPEAAGELPGLTSEAMLVSFAERLGIAPG